MPAIPPSAPTGNYKFYDQPVTLPHIYTAGQTLDDNLAKFLNQQVATSVGNRFGALVRRELAAKDEANLAAFKAGTYTGDVVGEGKKAAPRPATVADLGMDAQASITAIFTAFEPGVATRGGTSESLDPIAAEMRRLAGVAVRDLYKAKGFKYPDMLAAKYNNTTQSMYGHHVDQYLAAKGDQLRAIVEAQFAAMKDAQDPGALDLDEAPAPAAQAAE